ncbi:MAG: phenylalanine--tRNA ligase subunit alpha [Gemmatimonadetes bacterium]|nr:phenylalanine--tRNA ligase subunit alpha [Gemmatimonadota bacterium]
MRDKLNDLASAAAEIATADASRLAELKVSLLGRKAGKLTELLRELPTLSHEERRTLGAQANELKKKIEADIDERERTLATPSGAGADVDGSMPGRQAWRGALHPVTLVVDEICEIFRELGFSRVTGPEAETEEYNFTKLNISLDHPAADAQDTFYVGQGTLLRTHTSPMQARVMETNKPPIRVVVPGQVYRRDAFDPSHSPVFEQLEGLAVDEGLSFVDFKAAIDYFVKRFFTRDTVVRFEPSFFPFVEPGAQVQVQCVMCRGSGCSTCKQSGFLEIMGAGMVHPEVFTRCGLDAERYTGYAFGMGPQRIAMLRYRIPDIRLFFEGDMRFLGQFT